MRLLAIDTGSEACSVAVADGDRLCVRSEIVGRGHAEILFTLIEQALAEAGFTIRALDRVAVAVGPGSFTGVRVGVAAARGLALALGQKAVGIGTLAIHAEEARAMVGSRPVLAVLAAGRGELYGALYASDGSELSPPRAATADAFAALVRERSTSEEGLVLAGSGADEVLAALGEGPSVAHRHAVANVAALVRLARLAPPALASPLPLYLRPPDAKPQAAALAHRP